MKGVKSYSRLYGEDSADQSSREECPSYAHGGFAVTDRRAALPQSDSGREVDNINT